MIMPVIYEDENLLVLNKPAGVLVHPTEKGETDTLVQYLLDKFPGIEKLAWPDKLRPGIVHRLDKDTSGIIILAKTPEVLEKLQQQFKERKIQKTYVALVLGETPKEGKIEAAIVRGGSGKQEVRELNFSARGETLRSAITEYKLISQHKYQNITLSLLEVSPKTGRIHQIRTHLKHEGFPIIGDGLYNTKESRNISKALGINRQFLHAKRIEFVLPENGKSVSFEAPLPEDLNDILTLINVEA